MLSLEKVVYGADSIYLVMTLFISSTTTASTGVYSLFRLCMLSNAQFVVGYFRGGQANSGTHARTQDSRPFNVLISLINHYYSLARVHRQAFPSATRRLLSLS